MEDHTNRALIIVMVIILIVIAILIFLPHEGLYAPYTVVEPQPAVIRTTVPVQSHIYTTTSGVPSSSSSSYQQNTTTTTTTQQ
jgi:hypothetical protein